MKKARGKKTELPKKRNLEIKAQNKVIQLNN